MPAVQGRVAREIVPGKVTVYTNKYVCNLLLQNKPQTKIEGKPIEKWAQMWGNNNLKSR